MQDTVHYQKGMNAIGIAHWKFSLKVIKYWHNIIIQHFEPNVLLRQNRG